MGEKETMAVSEAGARGISSPMGGTADRGEKDPVKDSESPGGPQSAAMTGRSADPGGGAQSPQEGKPTIKTTDDTAGGANLQSNPAYVTPGLPGEMPSI